MRAELEVIQTIERYLMNDLNPSELKNFEIELNTNEVLQQNVNFQRDFVNAIKQYSIKNAAKQASKNYRIQKILKVIFVAALVVSALIATVVLMNGNDESDGTNLQQSEAYVEIIELPSNDELNSASNNYLAQEFFGINQTKDTVIETKDGLVIYLPAYAFSTDEKWVDFLVQEAFTPADILYSGLNTVTDKGEALETGGMFYLDAFANGERVDLQKELSVDIPADPNKTEMQLYDGVKNEEGELAWTNPKVFSQPLLAVEITELDFYPPGYETAAVGFGYTEKSETDSLYYSFAQSNISTKLLLPTELIDTASYGIDPLLSVGYYTAQYNLGHTLLANGYDSIYLKDLGINPASVKTIWNSEFNNTNLATEEFEARMPLIHSTCRTAILELYINNLDKNLCTIDSMAANQFYGNLRSKFLAFAAKGDGIVENNSTAASSLAAYYQKKRYALQQGIKITQDNYWKTQAKLDNEAIIEQTKADKRRNKNQAELNKQEIEYNTNQVYGELGMALTDKAMPPRVNFPNNSNRPSVSRAISNQITAQTNLRGFPARANRPILRANISDLGWKNVDCLMSISLNRESVKIKGNGRQAEVKYTPINFKVATGNLDLVYVYAIPKEFNSFVKLKEENGKYTYQLNDKLTYEFIALGWKGEQFYYAKFNSSDVSNTLQLKEITKSKWEKDIKESLGEINGMREELDYTAYVQSENKRKAEYQSRKDLRSKIRPFVFPCEGDFVSEGMSDLVGIDTLLASPSLPVFQLTDSTYIYSDANPNFPGGYGSMMNYINTNFKMPIGGLLPEEHGVVYVSFTVMKDGSINNVSIRNGISDRIDREVMKTVKNMPSWKPGELEGVPVNVPMTIPLFMAGGSFH